MSNIKTMGRNPAIMVARILGMLFIVLCHIIQYYIVGYIIFSLVKIYSVCFFSTFFEKTPVRQILRSAGRVSYCFVFCVKSDGTRFLFRVKTKKILEETLLR